VTALGRILIVDDEEPVLDVLSEYFAGQGYAVQTAASGAAALAAVGRERPDLVLLDVRMPAMDGGSLDELELLLAIAGDLGDLSPAARSAVDTALKAARAMLPGH